MEWKYWLHKTVFIRTQHGKVFSGIVQDIDTDSPPLVWITLLDKYNKVVQLIQSEITEIKEEE